MTDRQPDDLYDALRDHLADYGQEPPAPLWANIRAQLPPPVAAPRRRRRRIAWLATLLLLFSSGMMGWWQAGRGALRAGGGLASQGASGPSASQPSKARSVADDVAKARVSSPQPASISDLGTTAETAGEEAASNSVAAQPAGPAFPAAMAMTSAQSPRSGTKPTNVELLTAARAARSSQHLPEKNRMMTEAALGAGKIITPSAALTLDTEPTALLAEKPVANQRLRSDSSVITTANAGFYPIASQAAATPAVAVARPATARAALPLETPPAAGSSGAGTNQEQNTRTAPTVPTLAAGTPQPAETRTKVIKENTLVTSTSAQPAWQPMALRPAAVSFAPSTIPAPLTRADTLPRLPLATGRRWAVQALAGPALTSRSLGFGQLNDALTPAKSALPALYPTRGLQNTAAPENERAAIGFGAEVQLQRQLNGRWSLGTGLGYHAFAINQTVNVRGAYGPTTSSNFLPDSVGTLSVRDTYHFLTLPLRVGYQLGAGPARLRYGVRAGADVAFYLGGRSTEGGSTGSISRSWGTSGSPYRPLSLALSLGAEVRYRLAPGWELVAQPTLTHFITSVARPASGYVARYPLAASALVGVAWWLR